MTSLAIDNAVRDSKISGRTMGGTEEGIRPSKPPGRRHAVLTYSLHGTTSKSYVDQEMDIRTFYVTQDRDKPTDSA